MTTFIKANIASLTASFVDYLLTILLKQVFKVDPVLASILGTVGGGLINFIIGRYWVFKSTHTPALIQGKKYLLTWSGNLILNALGAFVLIRLCGIHYIISKIATSITVAIAYNYPIQKKYVFNNIKLNEKD